MEDQLVVEPEDGGGKGGFGDLREGTRSLLLSRRLQTQYSFPRADFLRQMQPQ